LIAGYRTERRCSGRPQTSARQAQGEFGDLLDIIYCTNDAPSASGFVTTPLQAMLTQARIERRDVAEVVANGPPLMMKAGCRS